MEIIHPVLILNFLSSSSCNSARTKQMLSELDNHRESYDVMWIFQDGGHTVVNILLLSGFMTSRLQEGKELFAYQFSTRYLNPRPSYYYFWLLKTNVRHTILHSRFRRTLRRHRHVILHWPTKFYANRMIADGVMASY